MQNIFTPPVMMGGSHNQEPSSICELAMISNCRLEQILDHPDLQKELRKDGEVEVPLSELSTIVTTIRADISHESSVYLSPVVDFLTKPVVLLEMIEYLVEERFEIPIGPRPTNTLGPPPKPGQKMVERPIDTSPYRPSAGDEYHRSIYDVIPEVTLTSFAPLPPDSYAVHLRKYYEDGEGEPGQNAWCRLTLDPPQETCSMVSSNKVYKFPFIIHEIITDGSKRLIQAIADHEEALATLFNFFSARHPLNPVLLGYTSSAVSSLMSKLPLEAFFEKYQDEVVDDLFFHLENRSVAEILKMVIFEERGKVKDPEAMMNRLFACMDLSKWPQDIVLGERQENLFLIIRELIHSEKTCPLHDKYMHLLMNSEFPDMLMESVFHWHKPTVTAAIGILVELMMYLDPSQEEDVMIQQMPDGYNQMSYVDSSSVVNDFSAAPESLDDLDPPPDHRFSSSEDDHDFNDGLSSANNKHEDPVPLHCLEEPPLYPLTPFIPDELRSDEVLMDDYFDLYRTIWWQYERLLTDTSTIKATNDLNHSNNIDIMPEDDLAMQDLDYDAKDESFEGDCNNRLDRVVCGPLGYDGVIVEHEPVQQYPAPPKLYQTSGEFFDRRLRKYMGRLLVEILEPLASAAVAHRDRRRNKQRGERRKLLAMEGEEEEDPEADKESPLRLKGIEGSLHPHNRSAHSTARAHLTNCTQSSTLHPSGANPQEAYMSEAIIDNSEPMPWVKYSALYPDKEDPNASIDDPYFTLDWLECWSSLPACDPNHSALHHLLDVIPPEYKFGEFNSGRKVAFGLVQNAFQNGVRPVVGHRLLEILHLFRAFIRVQGSKTFQFYVPKILTCAYSLLFAHKWNSILHISLGDIIIYAIQRAPPQWPDVVDGFIRHTGFFSQSSRIMKRYIRYVKDPSEFRKNNKKKSQSGVLPIILEILRILQDLTKCSTHFRELIHRECPDWQTWTPYLEELNIEAVEWGQESGAIEGR